MSDESGEIVTISHDLQQQKSTRVDLASDYTGEKRVYTMYATLSKMCLRQKTRQIYRKSRNVVYLIK